VTAEEKIDLENDYSITVSKGWISDGSGHATRVNSELEFGIG